MARNTNSGCLCRVPVTEAAVPGFRTSEELDRWAASAGVEILPDHQGRPSISLPDAYRLYAEAEQHERAHREAEAARLAADRAEVATARAKRQETYAAAYTAAVRRGKGTQEASQLGWEAVAKAERRLPPRITDRLGGVRIPQEVA